MDGSSIVMAISQTPPLSFTLFTLRPLVLKLLHVGRRSGVGRRVDEVSIAFESGAFLNLVVKPWHFVTVMMSGGGIRIISLTS